MSSTELEQLRTLKKVIDSGKTDPPDKSPLQKTVEAEVPPAPPTEGMELWEAMMVQGTHLW